MLRNFFQSSAVCCWFFFKYDFFGGKSGIPSECFKQFWIQIRPYITNCTVSKRVYDMCMGMVAIKIGNIGMKLLSY